MKFFRNWFKKKEEVNISPVKTEDVKEYSKNAIVCEFCKREIYQHDKRVTKANKKLHTKCWRKLRKKAMQSNFQTI